MKAKGCAIQWNPLDDRSRQVASYPWTLHVMSAASPGSPDNSQS